MRDVCAPQTRVEGKPVEDTKKDNIAQIYTDTKQDMELWDILDLKHRLDCRGNPGHKQCWELKRSSQPQTYGQDGGQSSTT